MSLITIQRDSSDYDRKSRELLRSIRDRRKVLLASAVAVDKWIQKNFEAEGRNHKNPKYHWKELSEVTIEMRRARLGGRGSGNEKILKDRGNLKRNWQISANNNHGIVKSKVNYSSLHENGGTVSFRGKRVKVPQRKIFPDKKQLNEIINPVFELYANQLARNFNE